MKFKLSSTSLNNSLQTLAKVIASKNTLPILESFLFEVNGNVLTITGSDNENVMRTTLPLLESDGNGVIAIPSRTTLDVVKELPEQPLAFDIDTNTFNVEVTYQNGKYNFTAQDGTAYPKPEGVSEGTSVITIPANILNANITRSMFAIGSDDMRPVMNGLYFDLQTTGLSIVASDGHKLVRNVISTITGATPAAFILPKKPATLLKNVLPKDNSDVVIKFGTNSAEIIFAGGTLTCRLIEGRYPNYSSVIPESNPNQLTIDRLSLLSALRRVLPFASESTQLIRFKLEAGKLEISSEDIDFSTSAKEAVNCDYTGNNMSIGFKGGSMTDILNSLESDEVTIQLADPSRAGLILPSVQPESADVLMLLMPMLLND